VVGCWRGYQSGARCRLAYGPADATVLPFWYQLTRVVPDKGLFNGCMCVVSLLLSLQAGIVMSDVAMCAVTELSLITMHWFLTMFASVVHTRILLRLWDLFFYEGSTVLFQVTLGMLKMKVSLCGQ